MIKVRRGDREGGAKLGSDDPKLLAQKLLRELADDGNA
jgi:hypothetical protein